MSAAPAAVPAEAPPAKGKKKLIIIIAAAALVLAGGGGAAMVLLKKKVDPDAEGAEDHAPTKGAAPSAAAKRDPKAVPVFVPLDPFTVNLADRTTERFAQVGVTLELEDAHFGDQIKNYMPAIRNNILLVIADRTAAELMGREGKAKLAERIRRAASKALGAEVEELEDDDAAGGSANATAAAPAEADADTEAKAKPRKKKKKAEVSLPIKAVHFSNLIIQ